MPEVHVSQEARSGRWFITFGDEHLIGAYSKAIHVKSGDVDEARVMRCRLNDGYTIDTLQIFTGTPVYPVQPQLEL
jgi:hypothetical protein